MSGNQIIGEIKLVVLSSTKSVAEAGQEMVRFIPSMLAWRTGGGWTGVGGGKAHTSVANAIHELGGGAL